MLMGNDTYKNKTFKPVTLYKNINFFIIRICFNLNCVWFDNGSNMVRKILSVILLEKFSSRSSQQFGFLD